MLSRCARLAHTLIIAPDFQTLSGTYGLVCKDYTCTPILWPFDRRINGLSSSADAAKDRERDFAQTALQLLGDSAGRNVRPMGEMRCRECLMPYQSPHQVRSSVPLATQTIEELLAEPSRVKGLVIESIPELLSQLALRVAALKTLEGTLLSLMFNQRGQGAAANKLLAARELAEIFGVPESWVREQARLGNLPSFKLGHYVRFRIEEVERYLAERANQTD